MLYFLALWKKFVSFNYVSILILSILIVSFGSITIHILEPQTFPTLFDGLWWTMTTLTTVGYGDFFPKTVAGKCLGMFLFIFGVGIIGLLVSKTVDSFSKYHRLKLEGRIVYKDHDHFIYIGWSKKTRDAIEELFDSSPNAKIVLIENLETSPYEHPQVHFIQGDPSIENTLLNANIFGAKRVCIFADSTIEDSVLKDGKTLLIASAVESLSTMKKMPIHTIVEISKESHIVNFKHVNVDDFVLSYESVSRLIAKTTLHPGTSTIFRHFLNTKFDGSNIHVIVPNKEWKTYEDAFLQLFEKGATLLAINEQLNIPKLKECKLNSTDRLYIYCEESLLKKITKKALSIK
ncbi:potassium channel protein [Bacillus sp. AFS001701]|uniref:potassium channel family protein n=1 Tax=Bacillaceae TaxID=186817 RepID=UPI000BF31062|nr:potassium channel family protein [Bacillus sp. AFS001701]PET71730.1 potassium channel protein [Bacillus sp. AFS001701]